MDGTIIGLVIGIVGCLITYLLYRRQLQQEKKDKVELEGEIKRLIAKPDLNIIAWDGIGDSDITSVFEEDYNLKVTCLEYVRGVEKITHLRMEDAPFDVAIVDREFLRHFNTKRIIPLTKLILTDDEHKKIEELKDEISNVILHQIPDDLGIPVRCGLNAVLLDNSKVMKILNNRPINSYGFLRVEKLSQYPDTPKIGIWNWYLPTLAIFLLAEGVSIDRVFDQEYHEDDPNNKIKKIIDGLITNKKKLKLFNMPSEIQSAINRKEIWVLPGGGGWNLPLGAKDTNDWRVVVPNEGAFLWVECICMLFHGFNRKNMLYYVEYLSKKKTQQKICLRKNSYKACPVLTDFLKSIPSDMIETSDINRIFADTCNDNFNLSESIRPRQLPDDWRGWERAWDRLLKEIS